MQTNKHLSFAVCLSFVFALPAWAADVQRLHAEQSVQLNAPAEQVWAVVGKFEGLHAWHPVVKSTTMRNPMTRILDLGEGKLLTEELEAKSDSAMTLSYRISNMSTVETLQINGKPVEKKVLPVNTYSSTLSVKAAGTGSQVIWSGDFHPAWLEASPAPMGMGNQDAIAAITGVYQAGLTNLPKVLGNNPATVAPTTQPPTQTVAATPQLAPAPALSMPAISQVPAIVPVPAPAQPAPPPVPVAPTQPIAVPAAPVAPVQPAAAPTAPVAPAQPVAAPAVTVSPTQPAAAPPPVQVAVTPAGGKPYEGHVKCEGGSCKIDTFMIKGFRTFGQCQVCHGIDGGGSTIAPSLLLKLQQLDHATFVDRVTNGFKGQIGVMPPWKENPNIMNNIENLYAYLKARSDGVIPAGNLERF